MDTASAPPGRFRRAARSFREWRHTRPFWGGLLVILGGLEILASERAPLPLIIHIGLQGLAGYLVPAILVLCGLLLLFHPVQRLFYSLLAVVLALASWVTSNLGGFFVGMLLGLIGGALAFAWVQRDRREPARREGSPGQGSAPRQGSAPGSPPNQGSPPRHAKSAGLALIRGDRRPDQGSRGDRAPADSGSPGSTGTSATPAVPARSAVPDTVPTFVAETTVTETASAATAANGAPAVAPVAVSAAAGPVSPAILAMPLAPLALSMLATLAGRGLLAGSVPAMPLVPPAVSPSVSPLPGPPRVPAPRPSADPSPSRSGKRAHHRTARRPAAEAAADPFSLTARFAALSGLSYDGVAAVPTAHGTQSMLKFTMRTLRLPGVLLTVTQGGGSFVSADSVMEFSGNVEFYTTRLTGELNGIAVTFTSAKPPAGLPANLTLTKVVAAQPFATADVLRAVSPDLSTG